MTFQLIPFKGERQGAPIDTPSREQALQIGIKSVNNVRSEVDRSRKPDYVLMLDKNNRMKPEVFWNQEAVMCAGEEALAKHLRGATSSGAGLLTAMVPGAAGGPVGEFRVLGPEMAPRTFTHLTSALAFVRTPGVGYGAYIWYVRPDSSRRKLKYNAQGWE